MYVGLDHQVDALDFAAAGVGKEVFQFGLLLTGNFDLFEFALAEVGNFARFAFVFDDDNFIPRVRRTGEAEDFHRRRGTRFLQFVAVFVKHGADFAVFHTGQHDVAFFNNAGLDKDSGNATATTVKAGLDDDAAPHAGRWCGEFENFGLDEDFVEQVVNAFAAFRRNVSKEVFAAPVFGDNAVLGQFGFDFFRIGIGLVDFVDSDDERYVGGTRVLDGLDGLRHDAIVSGDDENDDIGRIRTTCTHGGKGGVTRGIKEGDSALRGLHAVGADVLGNTTRFAGDDFGLADVVEQRGFTVVNVAHDGHDRRTLDDVTRVFVGFSHDLRFEFVFFEQDVLVSHFFGDKRGGFLVEQLVNGHHRTQFHHDFDQFARFDAHFLRQFTDSDGFRDTHFT